MACGSLRSDLIIWPETMLPDIGFDPVTTRDILEASPGWGRPFRCRIEEAVSHLDTPAVGTSTADGIDRSVRVGGSLFRTIATTPC